MDGAVAGAAIPTPISAATAASPAALPASASPAALPASASAVAASSGLAAPVDDGSDTEASEEMDIGVIEAGETQADGTAGMEADATEADGRVEVAQEAGGAPSAAMAETVVDGEPTQLDAGEADHLAGAATQVDAYAEEAHLAGAATQVDACQYDADTDDEEVADSAAPVAYPAGMPEPHGASRGPALHAWPPTSYLAPPTSHLLPLASYCLQARSVRQRPSPQLPSRRRLGQHPIHCHRMARPRRHEARLPARRRKHASTPWA